jgi:hypothetical protein
MVGCRARVWVDWREKSSSCFGDVIVVDEFNEALNVCARAARVPG